MKERLLPLLINGVIILLVSLLLFVAGTWWRLQDQFQRGEDAFQRGDFPGAVAGYESAIHMYLPFHPLVEQAAQKLWQIGELTEQQGNVDRALIAYRSLRSSFYAVHGLTSPGMAWISRCDAKIAALAPLRRER